MSGADLAAIREALGRFQAAPAGSNNWHIALGDIRAALDRIEQNTLTPEEARVLYDEWAVGFFPKGSFGAALAAKLERVAGDTGEAKELPPDARWALETLADRIERDERRPDPPRLTPRDFG